MIYDIAGHLQQRFSTLFINRIFIVICRYGESLSLLPLIEFSQLNIILCILMEAATFKHRGYTSKLVTPPALINATSSLSSIDVFNHASGTYQSCLNRMRDLNRFVVIVAQLVQQWPSTPEILSFNSTIVKSFSCLLLAA